MVMKVALNGFGRIGRHVFRGHYGNPDFEIVAINDLFPVDIMAYLLKYDSVYKTWEHDVTSDDGHIIANGKPVTFTNIRNLEELPWGDLGIDIVIEATGAFTKREDLQKHIDLGPKKVVLTAPGKGDGPDISIVMGCNDEKYEPANHNIISNASCTTNCFAPMVKVIHANFGIINGLMTTIHAYTATQSLLDVAQKDKRRSRAAALNMMPSSTGAARAISLIFPEMKGKLDAMAFRVPTPTVSSVDFVCNLEKGTTVEEVNKAFKDASEGDMKRYLAYIDDELVSGDFIGDPHSCSFDSPSTLMIGDKVLKTIGWYDNEWGYSCRMIDLVSMIVKQW
jgi:glyceraldehyde 3-phosphate dehydrogenase